MMRILLLVTPFLTFHVAAAQNVAALDAKYGFRSYKFGMHSNGITNLVKIKTELYENHFINKYKKRDEKLTVGPYKLKSITYKFYKDKLMSVLVEPATVSDGRGILELLQNLYGKTTHVAKEGWDSGYHTPLSRSEWFGSRVELSYLESAQNNTVSITYMGKEVYDEMFKDEEIEQAATKSKQALQKKRALEDL